MQFFRGFTGIYTGTADWPIRARALIWLLYNLAIFLKFHRFQPRYSYIIYSYKKGVYYYGINCVKLKPVVLLCARNNYILNSVYLRSLVDFENKSCVRVPLVIKLPECELNQLSRRCKKALQMVCEQFRFTWCVQIKMYELGRDYFHVQNETRDERSRNQTSSRKIEKLTSYKMTFNLNSLFEIRLALWRYIFTSDNLSQLLFSKSTNDQK